MTIWKFEVRPGMYATGDQDAECYSGMAMGRFVSTVFLGPLVFHVFDCGRLSEATR